MKTLQKCFLLAVAVLLAVGLVRTLCFPKEINDYENRYASQFPAASTSSFLDGTFLDEAESSLSDQGTTSSPTGPAPSLTTRRTWTARAPC